MMKISECAKLVEEHYPHKTPTAIAVEIYTVYREAMFQKVDVTEDNYHELLESSALRATQSNDQLDGLIEAWAEQTELFRSGSHDIARIMELATQNGRLALARSAQDVAMWQATK